MRTTRTLSARYPAIAAAVAMVVALGSLPPANALVATPAPALVPSSGEPLPAILDVTGWTRLSSPPSPDAGDGIGPGSYLLIKRSPKAGVTDVKKYSTYICTANFLWSDPSGPVYLGAAGHCFLPEDATTAEVGTNSWVDKVEVCVSNCLFGGQLGTVFRGTFRTLGSVVYARQNAEGDPDEQVGHDFGMVIVPADLHGLLRPAMPVWGGPTEEGGMTEDDPVCMYGNGFALGETFATKARAGTGLFDEKSMELPGAWSAAIAAYSGDSGSAIEHCGLGSGGMVGTTAFGIVTHGLTVPAPLAFGTTVARAKEMVSQDWGGRNISLLLPGGALPSPPPTGPNTPPVASFTYSCGDSATCTFDASGSSDSDGTIASYAWDFGDGTTGTGKVVKHKFGGTTNATYSVQLTVTDDRAASATTSKSVSCTGKGKSRRCS